MALTDIQIKALKPREKKYSVSDGRGLILEIRPNGENTGYSELGTTVKKNAGTWEVIRNYPSKKHALKPLKNTIKFFCLKLNQSL